jgi:hypothetical protein
MTTPTMTIAKIIPMTEGTKFKSDIVEGCVSCGVGVAAAGSTLNAVVAVDGQYPCVPANVATTVYLPEISGCHT